jgi:hypothetical protein
MQMRQCLHLAPTCLTYDSIDVLGVVVDLVLRVLVSIERRGVIGMSSSEGAADAIMP